MMDKVGSYSYCKRDIYIYTYMGMYKPIYIHSVYISSQCIRETHEFMNEVFMYS